jgi:alpha-glucuronidase
MRRRAYLLALTLAVVLMGAPADAEDGYRLWLRYPTTGKTGPVVVPRTVSPMILAAKAELERGLAGRVGRVLLLSPSDLSMTQLRLSTADLGEEGYIVRSVGLNSSNVSEDMVVVAANTDRGLLYGAFALLRHLDSGGSATAISLKSVPRLKLRIIDHWDNLDGFVERGYAGRSIFDWWTLPEYKDPLYTDYARAEASIGINGTVLNNVGAQPEALSAPYIAKAAVLAGIFRSYGIKVYLSVRFTAPIQIGGLKTADPLDPAVQAWWKAKADEIYKAIPDFGGFLVKANSEGLPGPRDYRRTQAEGANVLAAALAPYGGVVMWRAFVYSDTNPEDRAKQAYNEFKPLDGKFAGNVLVQAKNGAIDFQPREPFHPLFGALPETQLMLELQITKEYLGQATSFAYLGPLFSEVLNADTYAKGQGTTVAKVIDGSAFGGNLTGIAGVANTGRSRDWSGSTMNQANWYAFGRLAWDPSLRPEAIAREWAAQTFSPEPTLVDPLVRMMMTSREAVVDYTGALGLAHLFAIGHHYGPGPWIADLKRPEWNPAYYHRADKGGIGFDRTKAGSDAIGQYVQEVAATLYDPATTPETALLWFHHVSWNYRMKDGKTLWAALVGHYDRGVAAIAQMRSDWRALKPLIDRERWEKTDGFLSREQDDAKMWRDASLAYWVSLNGLPLPTGSPPPEHGLDWYKALSFPYAPGNP